MYVGKWPNDGILLVVHPTKERLIWIVLSLLRFSTATGGQVNKMGIEMDALVDLWDKMCNRSWIVPTIRPTKFECYWLLLRSEWKVDSNHPDMWMYSFEIEPTVAALKGNWKQA